ncbi:MAG: hypothetical protein HC812_05285 [Leptolyngbya sp. RL_3_1]|nr:hypothetical protein [Leptolyngbya sp. RL_3_1]
MRSAIFFSKRALTLGTLTVMSAGAVFVAPAAQAATYYDLDFETTISGDPLDAYQLDTAAGQYGFSTTLGNIGEIWLADGITITGYDSNYITDPDSSGPSIANLGLFNSNCIWGTEPDANAVTEKCQRKVGSKTRGDNDLSTRYLGENNLGNLLIFEENPGDFTPDDTRSGGTFVFDFMGADKDFWVESLSVVDDAEVTIQYFYKDGTPATTEETGTVPGDNDVTFFSGAQQRAIAKIAVQFEDSGGIGGIRLKEIEKDRPRIPEPTATLGLFAFGAVATCLKRRQQDITA